mgnify:CR=1 FL=1
MIIRIERFIERMSSSYIYIYLFHTLSDQALIFADIAIYIGMLIYHREKKNVAYSKFLIIDACRRKKSIIKKNYRY